MVPKNGFWGHFDPLNMTCHQRYPKRHIWAWNHTFWAINVSDPSIFVICRRDERICFTACLCVWVKKNLNFPYFLSKIGFADFARIVHNNSTLRRNHIFWTAFTYLYSFYIYGGGSNFPFFHIFWSWLLTQRIAYRAYAWYSACNCSLASQVHATFQHCFSALQFKWS